MTTDSLSETAALRAPMSEMSDAHVLAEMLGFFADRLMALDIAKPGGASVHERSDDRVNRRNHCPPGDCTAFAGRGLPVQSLGDARRGYPSGLTALPA